MLPRRTLRATSRTAKKPANSLVNPWVSRMNSSAKQISPISHCREAPRAWPIFPCPAGSPETSWKPSRTCRLRAGICRQRQGIRQGGKLGMAGARPVPVRHKSNCATDRSVDRPAISATPGAGKPSLTVFCCNRSLSQNISASGASSRDLQRQGLRPLDFESAKPSVVKSIKQRDLLNTWLRLYARKQSLPRIDGISTGADRGRTSRSRLLHRRHRSRRRRA